MRGLDPGEAHRSAEDMPPPVVFGVDGLTALIQRLRAHGYHVLGPTVRDGAIIYGPVRAADDLPRGHTDEMGPARYRLARGDGDARFGYTLGALGWKRFLHPEALTLWRARRTAAGVELDHDPACAPQRLAFLGVRACEVAAIRVHDQVLRDGAVRDPVYAERRERIFIAAVNCTAAAATCFCASVGSGPRVADGADLILTELIADGAARYVCAVGSARAAAVLADVPHAPATSGDLEAASAAVDRAKRSMERALDPEGVREALRANPDHPRWDEVAARCLGCGNCTLVCPTCFCTTVEDVTDLSGQHLERRRVWDSCFTLDFSYIHGGSVRPSARARYRQWLTHKLSTWWDQFGMSGCVGCGRCIAWCPAGIDLTEEVRAIRASTTYRRRSLGDAHGITRAPAR
jgi:ferredoxin